MRNVSAYAKLSKLRQVFHHEIQSIFFLCFGSSGRRFLLFLFNFFEWENDVRLISSFMEVFEKTKVEKMY